MTLSPELARILRFLAVGGASFVAYTAVMSACYEWLHTSLVPATIAAFVAGTLVSWLGNSLFVFRAPLAASTGGRFAVVTLIGMLLNVALGLLFAALGFHYLLIATLTFVIVPIFNYVMHRLWTFSGAKPAFTALDAVEAAALPAAAEAPAREPWKLEP